MGWLGNELVTIFQLFDNSRDQGFHCQYTIHDSINVSGTQGCWKVIYVTSFQKSVTALGHHSGSCLQAEAKDTRCVDEASQDIHWHQDFSYNLPGYLQGRLLFLDYGQLRYQKQTIKVFLGKGSSRNFKSITTRNNNTACNDKTKAAAYHSKHLLSLDQLRWGRSKNDAVPGWRHMVQKFPGYLVPGHMGGKL